MLRRTTFPAAVASLLLVGAALAGCSTGAGGEPDVAPESSAPAGVLEVDAAWLDGGSVVGLVTWGSSSCVPRAGDAGLESGLLRVELVDPEAARACTRDYVPRATAVAVPAGVDPAEDLPIEVTLAGGEGEVVLAGVTGLVPTDGLSNGGVPTAGWTGTDGTFALLTWGSSTCTPTVQDAAVTAPGEITVNFVDPPDDQVCTADFGPRVTVAAVQGTEAETAYELVLHGDGFEGARVAIAGANRAAGS
jgi:hypothetical protein